MAAVDRATLAANFGHGGAKRQLFVSPDRLVAALIIFGAALAWATCVRLPILSSEGMDEAFYAEVAHLWTRGVLPYAGAFDVKPPGYFALLALSQSLFGASLGSLRAISVVSDATTAAALFFIGRAMGSRTLGAFAALVSPPLSAWVTNNDCYPVLAAFTTLAFLPVFHASAIMKRAATAGLIIGAACTIKQTAAFEALGLLAIFLHSTEAAGQRARVALVFCLAAAAAPAGFLIYFFARGAAGPLIADTVFSALQRPGLDQGFFAGLMLFAPVQRVIAPAVVVAFLALLRRRAVAASAPDCRIGAVAIWLACAISGVLAQHMVYQNYLGPMLSPVILLAGAGAGWGMPEFAHVAPALRLAVVGLATVSTALYWRMGHFARPIDASPIAEASRMVLASRPRSDDKLLAIDFGGWSNVETDLAPPTPFFHRMHLLCSFPAAGPSRLAEALAARPRYVIVGEYLNAHSRCDGPDAWPLVKPALDASYRLLGRVAGKVQSFDVYQADPR